MPVKLPTSPSSSGDALGVDDNYQAYVYDPIEDEWVPGTVMEERTRQRAEQDAQPPAPPTNPETPPVPPARPDVSIADPTTNDAMDKLSEATVAAASTAAAAPAVPAQAGTTPDDITSDAELSAMGVDPGNRGAGPAIGAPVTDPNAAQSITRAAAQRRVDAALRSQAQSQGELEGQQTQQTVPQEVKDLLAPAGGVDNGQQWDDPYNVGAVFNGPTGMRPPQNEREMAIVKGDISTDSNLLENKIYDTVNNAQATDIPGAKWLRRQARTVAAPVADAVGAAVDATPVGLASKLPQALGIDTPALGDIARFAVNQVPELIPTTVGAGLTTLPIGELAGGGRAAARLARAGGVAARDVAERAAESEGVRNAAAGLREAVTGGEEGAFHVARQGPGGLTKAEAEAARNKAASAPMMEANNRLRQESAPLTEEMGYVAEGLQIDPVAAGIAPRADLVKQIAEIRAKPAGRTALLGKLEAQLEALDVIEKVDASHAFNSIGDKFAMATGQTPAQRAARDEFGRIHNAFLDAEDPGRFASTALKDPPAGVTFGPDGALQHPGTGNPDLQLAPQTAPTSPPSAPQLPGTESAVDVARRQEAAPVLGSMRDEGFRGEQGGLQSGLGDINASAGAERYQPGLEQAAAPAEAPSALAGQLGTPASAPNELDNLIEQRSIAQRLTEAEQRAASTAEPSGKNYWTQEAKKLSAQLDGTPEEIDRRIVELGKKTPYDDADVIIARAENASKVVPETPEMHDAWTQRLRDQGGLAHPEPGDVVPIRNERIAHIVLGPPAAGKNSATANGLRKSSGAMLVDSDEAKEMIPGFAKGRFAGAVHVESDKIMNKIMAQSVERSENMVIPLVGKNESKINALGEKLIHAGYSVRLHYVDLPEDEAAKRAVTRFHGTGRFVDPNYVLNEVDGHPRRTFENLKGKDWVSGYERKSNDVARGQPAVTIESTLDRSVAAESAAGPGIDDAGLSHIGDRRGDGEAQAAASAARGTPTPSEPFVGPAWRADTGFSHAAGTTGADVVRYEQEELGNDIGVSPAALARLERVPAVDVTWVAKSRNTAGHYGTAERVRLDDAVIVGEDGDGGYLVVQHGGRYGFDSQPIAGLAESLDPANQAAMERRAAVVRSRGAAAADDAGLNTPTTQAPQPPKAVPDTGPYVRQPDGTTVEATPEAVSAGVKRVLVRKGGIKVPVSANTDEAAMIIRKAVKEARTTGGRSLFGPGTDEDIIDAAINQHLLDGRVKITHTGGRGRIAAVFEGNDEEGALKNAMEDAGSHRPEAGVENALAEPAASSAGNQPPSGGNRPPAPPTAPDAVPADAAAEWERLQREGAAKRGIENPIGVPSQTTAPEQASLTGERQSVAPVAEGPMEAELPPWQKQQGPTLEQQRLGNGLERVRNQTMETPDFAPEGRGSAGGGRGVPPSGGEGQAAFPWKPGQPLGRKLLKATADLIFGVPRALKFGIDQSAPLRQGLWDAISHPAITVAGQPKRFLESGAANPAFGRGQGKMLADFATHPAREASNIVKSVYHADGALVQQWKAFSNALLHAHPEETDRVYATIGKRYADLKASFTDAQGNVLPGLYKAERGPKASLSAREEQVATSILDNVPGVGRVMRAGEDAFAMFLSKQRDDVFDNWVDTYRRLTGEMPSRQEANDIARWVNIKSGRGELPQNWANTFTVPFTAPRLYAAQVERLPVVAPFMLRSPEVRKQMMGDWVKVFGALSTSLALADATGLGSVDVNVHSPSADFLKIRIGNHRIDPWGGYAQIARLTARLVSGARSAGGVTYDSSWRDELTNFALSKLAPTAALAHDILTGKDFNHNELHWDWDSVKKEVQNTYAPLLFQDMIQGFQDDGLKGLAITAPSFFGLSVQTYPPGITELRQKAAQAQGFATFGEAPLSVQDKINEQPDIAKLKAAQPESDYQKAKTTAYAPIEAAQETAESSFKAGTNDTLIQDLWHDEQQQKIGTRTALEAAFTSTFNSHQKNQFSTALDGYFAQDVKRPDGSPDFDATTQKQRDYLAGLPKVQQDWIADFMDVGASKQSPLRQEYFKYLDDRKAAGYFDIDPKDPKYSDKLAALDKANPDLDVQNWYWKHTTAGDVKLNSPAAVDKALSMLADNPGRTVGANLDGVGTIARPINGNEAAWNDSKATLQKFADAKTKFEDQERARLAGGSSPNAASYNKPLSKLTPDQLSTIHSNIAKSLQTNSPQLDALLAYWGVSDTLNSQAAIAEYRKLQAKYGKDPAKAGFVVKVAAGAK